MNHVRRLVIDGQLWQTTAWDRGMGKYAQSLFKAYAVANPDKPVTIIMNQNLSVAEDRLKHLQTILPNAELHYIDLPVMPADVTAAKLQVTAILDRFLAAQYPGQAIDFLVLNLFTFDYCAAYPSQARKMLLFFDLIPLVYWSNFSKYFGTYLYFAHFISIYEANVIFSISKSTKDQLVAYLGVDPKRITTINGAYIAREHDGAVSKLPVTGRYVLMPSADYPHKNNLHAVQAFAAFNERYGNALSLVITSSFSDSTKQQLEAYSEQLVFTGPVSDEILDGLYRQAELLLFPSRSEGLGLPVLEAVHYDKPVVCSSIEVFKEISKDAFYYCDPEQPISIEEALAVAFIGNDEWEQKRAQYQQVKQSFTWAASAATFDTDLEKAFSAPIETPLAAQKLMVNIVMPTPSAPDSRLGQTIQSAYGYLRIHTQTKFYVIQNNSQPFIAANFLSLVTETFNSQPRTTKHEAKTLYAIDDSLAASEIMLMAIAAPNLILLATAKLQMHLRRLIDDGRLPEPLIYKAMGDKITHESCLKFLKDLGNTILIKDSAPLNKLTGWQFGQVLSKEIEEKIAC